MGRFFDLLIFLFVRKAGSRGPLVQLFALFNRFSFCLFVFWRLKCRIRWVLVLFLVPNFCKRAFTGLFDRRWHRLVETLNQILILHCGWPASIKSIPIVFKISSWRHQVRSCTILNCERCLVTLRNTANSEKQVFVAIIAGIYSLLPHCPTSCCFSWVHIRVRSKRFSRTTLHRIHWNAIVAISWVFSNFGCTINIAWLWSLIPVRFEKLRQIWVQCTLKVIISSSHWIQLLSWVLRGYGSWSLLLNDLGVISVTLFLLFIIYSL